MDEGPDHELDLARTLPRTADLLIRISAILNVDPSFFFCRAQSVDSSAPTSESGELLRLFHAIEDADTRRAALKRVQLLQTRDDET